MKKAILIFLALCCLLSSGCGLRSGVATDSGFIDKRSGIEYVLCNTMSLFAVSKDTEFITYNGETCYTVKFEESKKFLCIEDSGELFVYRASDVSEPDISGFGAIAAAVYVNNTTFITNFYADDAYLDEDDRGHNPTQDTSLCVAMTSALTDDGEVTVDPASITDDDVYFIRLFSEVYPGLYYLIVFFGDDTGRYYLRDRATGKTVICPKEVTARMVG